METFEVGVVCVWDGHKFVAGERAMKCLTCNKIMTNRAWEEKGKCFLGHTNAVPALATNPSSVRRNPSNISSSPQPPRRAERPLRWREENPPVTRPRSRTQLRWRDENPPVTRPSSRTQLRWRDVPTNNTRKWQIIVGLGIGLVLLFIIIMLFIK
jgi:hypothetical protein